MRSPSPTRFAHRAIAAFTVVAASATHATAQVTVKFDAPATTATAFGYAVGPDKGSVSFVLPNTRTVSTVGVQLFCVDFLDFVKHDQTYTANVSTLAANSTLAGTRHPGALTQYREAAFLSDQFAMYAGAADRDLTFGAIQGAIWNIFGTGTTILADPAGATTTNTIGYWTTLASDFAASAQYGTYDYRRFVVLTDASVSGTESQRVADGNAQEFLATLSPTTTTPEPASLALVGVGFLGVAGAAVRRRGLRA